MADNDNDRETSRTPNLVVLLNCSPFILAIFYSLFVLSPFFPVPFENSKSQITIGDACRRVRKELLLREKESKRERERQKEKKRKQREKRKKKDREKAKVNGVTWPKDAKLPKRSTRKA
ncbi:hypothetical protein ACS0PU_010302 [Formica fusca]